MVPTRNALLRIWPFARPHARGLAFSLVTAFGMMAAGVSIPALTGAVIDELDRGDFGRVVLLSVAVLGMGTIEAALAFARRYSAAVFSIAMEQDVRNTLYRHLQALPVSFHDGWQSGQLLSRAMGDLSTIRRFVGFGFIFLLLNATQLVVVLILMLRLHVVLAFVTALTAVPVMVLSIRFNRRYHAVSRQVQDDSGDITTLIEESATGIRIIKAFGRGAHMAERFRAGANRLHDSSMTAVNLRAFFSSMLRFLPALNMVVVVIVGGMAVIDRTMTKGALVEFVGLLSLMQWPVRSMGWLLANAEEARTAAERLFEVLDTPSDIKDRPGATDLRAVTGRIRFEGVSFRYPGAPEPTLHGVDLTIEPGETLAVVGMTGSGKTTLASLVPRLIDPTDGRITIDGVDLRDVTLSSLRSHIGVAFEDPVLFSMSVRENLLLGRGHAEEDEIRSALETANATFVYDLPWGLDTRIGEQGYSLSGGQRQRLALARAVIGRPQVLVLDDPLSAVDVHTEALIEEALERVLSGVTALLVVHRPSTLALADRVALLHDRTIVAVGTHGDLMAAQPLYREILSQEAEEVAR